MLNKTENFNILEGNVKEDNINVANNVAQRNSQYLTEQYKTGTLPNGFYYFDNGKNQYIVDYHNIKGFGGLEGVKVIAEVPSYKEWQTTLRHNKALDRDINNIIEMNGALGRKLFAFSELLKEWIHYYPIILYEHEDTLKTKDIIELYDRTREVLK